MKTGKLSGKHQDGQEKERMGTHVGATDSDGPESWLAGS